MDDVVHVVEKDPLGQIVALAMIGIGPHLRESLLNLIRDGLNLPRVATAAQKKIVGEGTGFFRKLQNSHVVCLFRLGGLKGRNHLLLNVVLCHQSSVRSVHCNSAAFNQCFFLCSRPPTIRSPGVFSVSSGLPLGLGSCSASGRYRFCLRM